MVSCSQFSKICVGEREYTAEKKLISREDIMKNPHDGKFWFKDPVFPFLESDSLKLKHHSDSIRGSMSPWKSIIYILSTSTGCTLDIDTYPLCSLSNI